MTAEEFKLQSARSVWRQRETASPFCTAATMLQSARSVWRQSASSHRQARMHAVAICTERVEAKFKSMQIFHCVSRCNLHGACGGKAFCPPSLPGQTDRCNLHGACGGKALLRRRPMVIHPVAICTERVEAKRSKLLTDYSYMVAICTERVEAKAICWKTLSNCACCNLHGACGGKAALSWFFLPFLFVAICTERVEAKIGNF